MTTRELGVAILDRLEAERFTAYDIELILSAAFKEFRNRQRERSRGAGGNAPQSLTAIEVVRRQEIARGVGAR